MANPTVSTPQAAPPPGTFRHEALLYAGMDDFLEGTLPFIADGLTAGEPVLVAVSAVKIAALRAELEGSGDTVHFADMTVLGQNPARIIPAWREFLDQNGGGTRPVRGIGEPTWAGRSAAELVECQRHETLLNVAFAASGAWQLLCPYDTATLDTSVIDDAEHSHPFVTDAGFQRASSTCCDLAAMAAPFDAPLPEPLTPTRDLVFAGGEFASVREFVSASVGAAGLDANRSADLVLAVHEIVTNSVRHGGGEGTLRMWQDDDTLICEVRDAGRVDAPLAGRQRPTVESNGGRGLWMVNQLCDLAQLRTFPDGSVARLHMRRGV